jgi:hypothetical protein
MQVRDGYNRTGAYTDLRHFGRDFFDGLQRDGSPQRHLYNADAAAYECAREVRSGGYVMDGDDRHYGRGA